MKILIYGEYFWPIAGGVQTVMDSLARGLAEYKRQSGDNEESIEVTLATRTPAGGMDDSTLPYRVVRQPRFFELIRLIRDADVVHLAGPCLLPLVIGKFLHKPTVIEHHGYQAICPNGLLVQEPIRKPCAGHFMSKEYGKCLRCCAKTMGWVASARNLTLMFPRRRLSRRVAANITVSDHVARRLAMPRSRTIYHGTAEAPETAGKPCTRLVSTPHSVVDEVAYVGRIVTEKGLPVLIEAVSYLKQRGTRFHLLIIGDGPERANLEQFTAKLGLRDYVRFTGDLRGEQLEDALANVVVVVMPSICEETLGMSAIEQMMRGRVVIAADIGGLGEVVGDVGLKFAAGNSHELAGCLERVLLDASLRDALGSAARERAHRLFNVRRMIEAHLSLYRQILRSDQLTGVQKVPAAPPEVTHETKYV